MDILNRIDTWVTAAILLWVLVQFGMNPFKFIYEWFIVPFVGIPQPPRNAAQEPHAGAPQPTSTKPVRLFGAQASDPMDAAPLAALSLDKAAQATTILVVGSRGSGKSVLIRALVGLKAVATAILDPHNAPGKWPQGAAIIGGGSNYSAIYKGMTMLLGEMEHRSAQLDRGDTTRFDPLLIAADEWGSITQEAERGLDKSAATPGEITRRMLKEGRKFGVQWVGGAHGDTAASLGSKGDTVAFAQSFDLIIYTGAFVRDALIRAGALPFFSQIPLGTTPEGNTFPLIVPAFRPTVGDWLLLDMRNALDAPTLDRPALDMGSIAQAAQAAPSATTPPALWNPPMSRQVTTHEAAQVAAWANGGSPSRALARQLYRARGGDDPSYNGSGAVFQAVQEALHESVALA
jgi:energy-coupling factor transporter ATP-binding protein EcfA2